RTGLQGQPDARGAAHGSGPRGQRRTGRRVAPRGAPGRPGDHPRLEAVQAGEPRMERREYGRPTPWRRSGRRDGGGGDRRSVLGGVRTADPRSGAAGARGGGGDPARGGLEASYLALCIPRARPARSPAPRESTRRDGTADLHRGHGPRGGRIRRRSRRHHSDRCPQHAELLAPQGRGAREEARAPQARAVGNDRGAAALRPVRAADARGPRHRGGDRAARRRARVGERVRVGRPDGRTVGRLITAVVLLSGGPAVRQSDDPWPVLDRASQTYQTISTLSADFVQIVVNPLIGSPDTTRGKLYQMRPSRFAMRFTAPKGDRIVADGRYLWLYTPSTAPGQVIRSRIPAVGTTGPNLIGQFVERPRERYSARYLRADSLGGTMVDVVALSP